MRFLSAGRLTLTMFALSFCLTINGQSEEPKKEEEPRFPLTVRVFSVGVEWRESYGNRIETFLWKKIDRSKIERGVGPIVFAADGSLWRQIDQDCRYGKPSEYTKGVFNTKLLKGEYRVSVANSKVYEEWEGPPGSRGGGGSGHQDYDTKIWHYDVGGVGGPQHVFGWVLDDPISIDGSEKEYERKITLEGVKATFTVTAPEKEAEKLTLRLYREDGFYLENGRSGSDHGLPSKTTFEPFYYKFACN